MTTILPEKPLLETKLRTTPGEFARLLRSRGDVFWWEPDRFWVVTGHEPATAILKGTDFSADRSAYFMSRLAGLPMERVGKFLEVVSRMMVTSDPPEHTRRRKLAAFGIADNVLDEFKPAVERTVKELVERAAVKGWFDLVGEIALPLPCTVLADLFCIPASSRADFYRWSNDMTQFFGGASDRVEEEAAKANAGAGGLRDFFSDLIAKRRKEPQADFLSHLLRNQAAMGLDDSEVISQAVMMLVAGSVTTTDQICNNMFTLLTEGPPPARLSGDPAAVDAALEEATRLDPAVNFIFRVARHDTRLGSAEIREGQLVFISNHAVNRDPAVFADPDRFRPDRVKSQHMGFGSGIHYCLGARLGRIQMSSLFSRLFGSFPALALDPEHPPVRKQQSLGFSGFDSLRLVTAG